jgi:hypothetical protein
MILCSQIYDTVLSLVRKDKRGLSFSPDDFNNAIIAVNQRIYRLNYANYESSKLSIDEMDSFLVPNYAINLDANGVGALPADYFHMAGDPWYTHATEGRRKIDLVTTLEFGNRELDFCTKSTLLYPTCYMAYNTTAGDMAVHVTPITCTPIYLSYLRKVATPFLDYYVDDTTFELIYMAAGATVTVPLGHTSRSGVAGSSNVVSQTVNIEWHDHDEPQIINLLLEAIGISLPDDMLIKVSNINEPKIEKS